MDIRYPQLYICRVSIRYQRTVRFENISISQSNIRYLSLQHVDLMGLVKMRCDTISNFEIKNNPFFVVFI
jgi:hypothetical protein